MKGRANGEEREKNGKKRKSLSSSYHSTIFLRLSSAFSPSKLGREVITEMTSVTPTSCKYLTKIEEVEAIRKGNTQSVSPGRTRTRSRSCWWHVIWATYCTSGSK